MNYFEENVYDAENKRLNLSHRCLRSLDEAIVTTFAHRTEYLDLSHNFIHILTWIYEFPHLKCLIMDSNRLREEHFEKLKRPLPNVQTLMLNKNEMSDLKTTANILHRLFPNVTYLSLHGNAMCPDNLLLQPFCEFVPYQYDYYRGVLLQSLPNLKYLDHFSLDSLQSKTSNYRNTSNEKQKYNQRQQKGHKQFLTSTSKNVWCRIKRLLDS